MIEKLNNSVNLIAFASLLLSLGFAAMHQEELAKLIVVGSLAALGGHRLAEAAKKEGQ